jgi:hypothetical protein
MPTPNIPLKHANYTGNQFDGQSLPLYGKDENAFKGGIATDTLKN